LKIFVRDDGCGIDPKILSAGREGHLGLSGMREAADRIGAKLDIWSRTDGSGTELELSVPDRIAYKKPAERFLQRLTNLFARQTAAGDPNTKPK
jgi:nitrate/nitrite-specific signal transduction histidine kinase